MSGGRSARPPRLAEGMLALALAAEDRGPVIGDLAEEFSELAAVGGMARARQWYWRQVLGSIPPVMGRRMARGLKALRRKNGDGVMSKVLHDLRYSLRALRRGPGFGAVVILTLALGIAANTIVFSTVDGIVLNPFDYPEVDRLVGVGTLYPKLGAGDLNFFELMSPPEYLDIAEGSRTLEKIVAWDMGNRQLTVGEDTENLFTAFWWGDAFPTLGVQPALGRGFSADEIERGHQVAVISHRVWQSRFGGDRSLVGGTVLVNGSPYSLVGIMPPGALIFGTDLWIPMPVGPEVIPRQGRQFQILARLAPGATLEEANVELEGIARRIEGEYGSQFPEYEGWRLEAWTWKSINVNQLRPAAMILLGAVAFILLLVCANVASLLLARSPARQRELAVRSALGAGWPRILRQLLTESMVLAFIGGVIGIGIGFLGMRAVVHIIESLALPLPGEVSLNGRVLTVMMAVSVAAGIAFGIVPALQASRSSIQNTLRNEGPSATSNVSRMRLQRVFVGIEVALALVMLVGGGLMINSFIRLQAVESGFNTESVLTMRLSLARERYPRAQIEPFFQQLRERVEAIPGVTSVATTSQYPPNVFWSRKVWIDGRELDSEATLPTAYMTIASPAYFQTLGIPLKRGRVLAEADVEGAPAVSVINETLARRYFPGEDPIGRRIKLGEPDSDAPLMEIVGIVGATHNRGLDADPEPEVYVSSIQAAGMWNQLFLIVRTGVEPYSVLPAVRAAIHELDALQPVYAIRTVDEAFARSSFVRRVSTGALTLFGVFALSLAALGIYGVVAYAANQRTREIGVRMTLGAEGSQVRRLIVRQALLPVLVGAVAGLAGAVALGRVLSSLLFEVSGSDPLTLIAVTIMLVGIALLASYIPALRASRLDPVHALRFD